MLEGFLIIFIVAFICSIIFLKGSEARFFLCTAEVFFIIILLTEVILSYSEIREDKKYESKLESYNQQLQEAKTELDEIISNYSDIKGYDYTKYLETMDYRKLIETYLPELLVSTKTSLGYSYRTRVEILLDNYKSAKSAIKNLEQRHLVVQNKKDSLLFAK